MKTASNIESIIRTLPEGKVVDYEFLTLNKKEYPAAAKALSRMVKSGLIKRASTGLFYRPKKTIFGELTPGEDQLLQPYLFKNDKRIAYVTGIALYNQMRLTTQVPAIIQVASRSKRITAKVGALSIRGVKSYVEVTDENYALLEILDAIKDFKDIPDMDIKSGLTILKNKLTKLSKNKKKELVDLALAYPPRTKALAGALLEWIQRNPPLTNPLAESLHALTSYKLGIDPILLPTIQQWNII